MKNNNIFYCKLTDQEYHFCRRNPHCLQSFCNVDKISKDISSGLYYRYKSDCVTEIDKKIVPDRNLDNIIKQYPYFTIDEIEGEIPYHPKENLPMSVVKLGQLKLFLTTFQFLSIYTKPFQETHVIYVGSAPGNNLEKLFSFFPHVYWHLYDPRRFFNHLYKSPKVKTIENVYFDKNKAKEIKQKLKKKKVLFISDIRTGPYLHGDEVKGISEECIREDNNLQYQFVKYLKPLYSQLKFRPPRDEPNYKYFKGKVYLQYFAPVSSTETRLVVDGNKLNDKIYNVEKYENKLFKFNKYLRSSFYPSKNVISPLDNCHDCVSLIYLMKYYKRKFNSPKTIEQLIKKTLSVKNVLYKIKNHNKKIINGLKKIS